MTTGHYSMGTKTNHPTSYFELMLQCFFATHTYPPHAVQKYPEQESNHQKLSLLRDKNPHQDFQAYTCQHLLTAFIRTLTWV